MADPVRFKLRAAPLPPGRLPRVLQGALRGTSPLDDDPFLPKRLLSVDQAYDLSPAARATDAGRQEREVSADIGQVVVLELPEGVTVITHPQNLREALARVDPQSVDADGAIVFERALRERGAALRGSLGDAVADGLSSIATQVRHARRARSACRRARSRSTRTSTSSRARSSSAASPRARTSGPTAGTWRACSSARLARASRRIRTS